MRIKLDENIPAALAETLRDFGHDADTVVEEGLTGSADDSLWNEVQREQRFLVTQDLDFSDARRFAPGTHHGILLVRLSSPGRRRVEAYLRALFAAEDISQWQGCLVVATDTKLRVRRKR